MYRYKQLSNDLIAVFFDADMYIYSCFIPINIIDKEKKCADQRALCR